MGQTPESAEQVHRVKAKPGPKPKVKAAIGVECPEGYVADGDYYRPETSAAQALALRIWSGQSPDVPVIERVARIVNGLREQGLDLDITLPHPDAERYLNAHK